MAVRGGGVAVRGGVVAVTGVAVPNPESRAALEVRNRLLALLMAKVAAVRGAAKYVFRNQPEIAREALSEYSRRTHAARRRAAKSASSAGAAPKA